MKTISCDLHIELLVHDDADVALELDDMEKNVDILLHKYFNGRVAFRTPGESEPFHQYSGEE